MEDKDGSPIVVRQTEEAGEGALLRLAASQHGVATRLQAHELGLGRRRVDCLIRSGRWVPFPGSVLVAAGAPPTPTQRAVIAVLGAGDRAVLSHQSAASYWGMERFRLEPLHILRSHHSGRPERPDVVVHTSRRLPRSHVVEVDGLRITNPARTIFDLSGTLRPLWRVEDALDDAWAAGLVDYRSMRRVIDEMSGRGQRNVAQIRALVENRGADHIAGDSALERRFHRIVAEAGLPPLERQVDLVDEQGWWGRVDGLYRDARIVAEVDGDRWHAALSHRRRDEQRRTRWEAMGYEVLGFREYDVWHRPDEVVARLSEARRRRLASGPPRAA